MKRTRRTPSSAAAASTVAVPSTLTDRIAAADPWIGSAAAECTRTSAPRASRRAATCSRMSRWMASTPAATSSGSSGSTSRVRTTWPSASSRRARWSPRKPLPPVIAQSGIEGACQNVPAGPASTIGAVAVQTRHERRPLPEVSASRGGLHAFARAARPVQWTKNLLVFAGIVFAAKLDDAGRWFEAVLIFVAFCLASSASYLVNDVHDVAEDRAHPVKRARPVASGELSERAALVGAAVLALLALAIVVPAGWESVAFVALFLVLQGAYTLQLKHVVLVDVLVVASLFVVRAAVGAVGIDVRLSPWLVLCTGLLALFLALGKRRGELVLVGADQTPGRPVLEGYSLELVEQLLAVVTASTISAYSIYTFTATDSSAMMLTIPFVVFGLFRYLYLVHEHHLGEEPDRVALTDVPILATVALWVATAAVILV